MNIGAQFRVNVLANVVGAFVVFGLVVALERWRGKRFEGLH